LARQHSSHVDDPVRLGARLHEARLRAGLRLKDLSFERCSIGYLSHIERGNRVPSLQVVRELARRLGVSEHWLAMGEEPPAPPDEALVEAEGALRFDDLETAERLYRDALGNDAAPVQARAHTGLGRVSLRRDDIHAALDAFEHALDLDPGLEQDDSFAESLGRAYATAGDEERAVGIFRRRLEAAQRDDDGIRRIRFAVLLANALIDLSAFDEAARVLADVVNEPASADPLILARLYWSQSRLYAMRRDTDAAARYARKALDLLDATELTQYRAWAYHLAAFIENDAGNHADALALVEQGRGLAVHGGTPVDLAKLDLEEARARAALGELERAASLIHGASRTLSGQHPIDVGRCFSELAAVHAAADDLARSRELYELALEYLERSPNRVLADTCGRFGALLERLGDRDAALETYKRGVAVTAQIDRASR
jgi:tetratricopeptide (TPR) repeat protein